MKKYNFLQAIYLSFFSKEFYRDVAQNWRGSGLTYLLLIVLLCAIPATHYLISNNKDNLLNDIKEIPSVVINSHISQDKIGGKITQSSSVTIDANQSKDSALILVKDKNDSVVIRNHEIHIQQNGASKQLPLSKNIQIAFHPEALQSHAEHFFSFAWFLIFPIVLLWSYVYRLLQVLFYSIFARIFNSVNSTKLEYVTLLRLTATSLTPVMILGVVQHVIGYEINFFVNSLIFFVIAMFYLRFAIRSNRSENNN